MLNKRLKAGTNEVVLEEPSAYKWRMTNDAVLRLEPVESEANPKSTTMLVVILFVTIPHPTLSHHYRHLSQNITLVLESLLRDYESSQPPSEGGPTVIRTNMLIRSMGPISELHMDYSMDCYFRQYWRDSRLSFAGPVPSLSLNIKMLERIWRPDTYFHNGKESYLHTITVPNKLLRITRDGDVLYSMRLTVRAKCPMELRNFPMDSQSCPLVLGSYAYTTKSLIYEWERGESVSFAPGMTLSQFDLTGSPVRNLTVSRRREQYSILQVHFNLQRNTGYFIIQVYLPCVLIVVLSWVSFWIHREATSDRVGLGITTVLTLSTISLDSRVDLPKVGYATALDWFLLMSFFYCAATLLEFAGVHYFTKVGSGDTFIDEDEWEDLFHACPSAKTAPTKPNRRICPIYNIYPSGSGGGSPIREEEFCHPSRRNTAEMETQTDPRHSRCRQFLLCLSGDEDFRKLRQLTAAAKSYTSDDVNGQVNSVSKIDKAARVLFPLSFALFNLLYWTFYLYLE